MPRSAWQARSAAASLVRFGRSSALTPIAMLAACAGTRAEHPPPTAHRNEADGASRVAQETRLADAQPAPPMTPSPRKSARLADGRPGRFIDLEVASHPDPIVWEPASEELELPMIVVAHGAGGDPDWHCDYWSRVVGRSAFLLCLRGEDLGGKYGGHYFPEHHTLERMLEASVAAAERRYGQQLRSTQGVYIGYSQGATMGALILPTHAGRFSRAILIEGGYAQWNVQRALDFKQAGGIAIFISCGTSTCSRKAEQTVTWFERAGSRAKMASAPGQGHTPAGGVGENAVAGLAWVLSQGR